MRLDDETLDYRWPDQLIGYRCLDHPIEAKIDLKKLIRILNRFDDAYPVLISVVSKEYLNLAKIWLSQLKRIEHHQFIIIATDRESIAFLTDLNRTFPVILLEIQQSIGQDFISKIGFDKQGLLITSVKYPVIKLVVEKGFDVIFSDIDALWLKPVLTETFDKADIAFQRVVYHPAFIAEKWGFAICTGFLFFKSTYQVQQILTEAIRLHQMVYCDQLAFNLAIDTMDAVWDLPYTLHNVADKKEIFTAYAGQPITGRMPTLSLRLIALPARTYYRNDLVPLKLEDVILFHPNSPKNESGKIHVFEQFGLP